MPIIRELIGADWIREIIVVDDGSAKETVEVLNKLPKKVTVLRHKRNLGKSAAMKTGLLSATGRVVVYVDADLCGFSRNHLMALCEPVQRGICDMSIGVRENVVPYSRVVACAAAYGGERAFDRRNLMTKISLFQNRGYTIEAALNKYFLKKGRVEKVFLDGVSQISKIEKDGLAGLLKSLRMSTDVVRSIGWKEFLSQTSTVNKLKYYVSERTL